MIDSLLRIPSSSLSARERQVLDGLVRCRIDKQSAAEMGVSLATQRIYKKRLQKKLGTQGPVQTVLVAWKVGLVDLNLAAEEALAIADERVSRTRESKPGRS